jgi:DNA-binding NarL/FixJ family response regulator
MPTTVAIIEDNEEICGVLAKLITYERKTDCVSTRSSREIHLEMPQKQVPQVVIMDIRRGDNSAIQCLARMRQLFPASEIHIYTIYADDVRVSRPLEDHENRCLPGRGTKQEIVVATVDARPGCAPVSGEIAPGAARFFAKPAEPKGGEYLTPRQEDILGLLARGFVAKEIAQQLDISVETVRYHLKNIYAKLHVRSKTEAVLKYVRAEARRSIMEPIPTQACR